MKLVALAIISTVCLAVSCGGNQSTQATQVEQVAYTCGTVDIGKTEPEIGMTVFQDVMSVIQAGADGWEAKLLAIGTKYGEDALACAVKAVYDALVPQTSGVQTAALPASALRARTFLNTRAYKFK